MLQTQRSSTLIKQRKEQNKATIKAQMQANTIVPTQKLTTSIEQNNSKSTKSKPKQEKTILDNITSQKSGLSFLRNIDYKGHSYFFQIPAPHYEIVIEVLNQNSLVSINQCLLLLFQYHSIQVNVHTLQLTILLPC